jgi:hypothetical protein
MVAKHALIMRSSRTSGLGPSAGRKKYRHATCTHKKRSTDLRKGSTAHDSDGLAFNPLGIPSQIEVAQDAQMPHDMLCWSFLERHPLPAATLRGEAGPRIMVP